MNSAVIHRLGDWISSGTAETSSIAKAEGASSTHSHRSRSDSSSKPPDATDAAAPDTTRKKVIFIVPRGIIHEFLFESENVCSRCFLIFINFNWTTFHRSKMVGGGGVWKGSGEYERRLRLPSDMFCSFIISFPSRFSFAKVFFDRIIFYLVCDLQKEVCSALPHSVLCVNSLQRLFVLFPPEHWFNIMVFLSAT